LHAIFGIAFWTFHVKGERMPDIHPEIEKLVAQGKLAAALAPKVSQLTPGTFVNSKSWGAGKVTEWDLIGDRMLIDFESKPGHSLRLEFAAKSLEPVPDTHFLARRFADKAGLQQLAESQPVEFVRLALQSNGGKMSIDALEDMVKGKVLTEARFKNWWENAKKALRQRAEFVVPAKRTLPLELRAAGVSQSDALLQDFSEARELKAKIKALEAILRDLTRFPNPMESLTPVAREAEEAASQNIRLKPGDALELLLGRDDLAEKIDGLRAAVQFTLPQAVSAAFERLHDFIGGLSPTKQQRVFGALPALGAEWVEKALSLVNRLSQRSLGELAKVFVKNETADRLTSFLRTNISQRNLSSEALAWVCWERGGPAKKVFSWDITPALMHAVERDHFDDTKKSNRVLDALMEDKELVADLLNGAEMMQVNNFARQVLLSPAFDELTKRSLVARIIRVYPEIEELVEEHSGGKKHEHQVDHLLVSWDSLEARRKAHAHLVQVEIPQNRKDIEIARSYGDLRENFEFKSAKEYQRVLMRRKMEMERDLARSRGTDFSEAQGNVVAPGTVVAIRDANSGQTEEYSVLGAWDSDPQKNVISYLTATAAALMGKGPGDKVQLPSEETHAARNVEIVSVRKWQKPAAPPPAESAAVPPEEAESVESTAPAAEIAPPADDAAAPVVNS
jgi:transcription elongation GreA/GreB family factor